MFVSFFSYDKSVQNGMPTSRNGSQTGVHDNLFIGCRSKLLRNFSQIPYLFRFHIRQMQSSSSFRFHDRGKARGHRASLARPSRSGTVTPRDETKINISHPMLEASRRNLRAVAPFAFSMEPFDEPPRLPVTQHNLNTATDPPENVQ